MLDNVRRYIDATFAVATMATFGIISGFVAFGVTGDRTAAFLAAGVAFALTGAVLMVRLWRMMRSPLPPPDPAA